VSRLLTASQQHYVSQCHSH